MRGVSVRSWSAGRADKQTMRIRQPAVPFPVIAMPSAAGWAHAQFRRTDDGAGGRLQTLRRSVKFWVRCWWSSRALEMSTAAFRDSALDSIVETQPELALRPLRSYLRRGLGALRRAQALREHFEWLSQCLPMATIDRLYAGEAISLLSPGDSPVTGLGLTLATAANLGREGELALHLEWHGQRAMSLGFSVLDASRVISEADPAHVSGRRIVIGTLQGARGADAALREMSAAAQRLRPSAMLVLGVQALSAAWGLAAPMGVAVESHVYAGYASRRRKVALDYDAAWQDAGALRTSRHYWSLPKAPVLRPEGEVESRRRAQHRRRNVLREALIGSVSVQAAAMMA